MPAQKRFHTRDPPRIDVNFWLVEEIKIHRADCLPKMLLEGDSAVEFSADNVTEDGQAIAAGNSATGHGVIRVRDQFSGADSVFRVAAGANVSVQVKVAALQRTTAVELLKDTRCDTVHGLRVVPARHNDEKLVSPDTADDVVEISG